jgi:hypothetical protein
MSNAPTLADTFKPALEELKPGKYPQGITEAEYKDLSGWSQLMYEGPTCTGCYLLRAEYDESCV